MSRIFLLLFLLQSFLHAQERFIIQVFDNNHGDLVNLVQTIGGVNIVRNIDFPRQNINAVAVVINPASIGQIRNNLDVQYVGNYLFALDPIVKPTEGSGDILTDPFNPSPPTANPALDSLVPGRPLGIPAIGHLPGNVLIDIIGTGIDYSHPDLAALAFEEPLSVMFSPGGGFLPGDVDFHNHETRLAGCIGGIQTGLLYALGTASDAHFRSVLCYPKPSTLSPTVPSTYTSDCIAAMAEVISVHEGRLATPYLHNHAAVLCFSHSVEAVNTRVGALDSLFDLAWQRGIVTSISAGNHNGTAAASSPAGAGEWIAFDKGGSIALLQYWPPLGSPTFGLPGLGSFGFETAGNGSDYHLKSGAHTTSPTPAIWVVNTTLGSGINTLNPGGYGPPENHGVDLFAPGAAIQVPATRLHPSSGDGPITVDDSVYFLRRGYQEGNGTSYSAAYTAALATRILQLRPWASPAQVRSAILDATTGPLDILTVPDLDALPAMSLTYNSWISRYSDIAAPGFFSAGLDSYTADPDSDGVANFIEYYCGMDPRYPDSQHAPQVTFNTTTKTFTAKLQRACYLPDPAEVEWTFEACNDLINWSDLGQGLISRSPHTDDNGDGIDIVADLNVVTPAPKKFYRFAIRVTP